MVSKLVFKGDKPKKRKHKAVSNPEKRAKVDAADSPLWMSASKLTHVKGPVMLAMSDEDTPVVVSSDMQGKIYLSTNVDILGREDKVVTHRVEPTSVQQVFVAAKANFDDQGNQIAFKSSDGKYLTVAESSESDGKPVIHAKAASIGQPQIFELESREDGWHIRTSQGKYLGLQRDDSSATGFTLRITDDAGFRETWTLRVQTKFATEETEAAEAINTSDYISSTELRERANRDLSPAEIKTLKTAFKEGRLNEALLDLRQKSSHDTYC